MKWKSGADLPAITKDIDQERILSWAGLSGDFNRLHVDPAYAKNTPFKGTIAHGPMALAFLNELMMASFDEMWVNGGRLLDVRFLFPIRPGDRIRVAGQVQDVREEAGLRWAECRLVITNTSGQAAVTGTAMVPIKGEII